MPVQRGAAQHEAVRRGRVTNYVYVLWQIEPFLGPSRPLGTYSTEEKALKAKKRHEARRHKSWEPEYDSYGLVQGTEFAVIKEVLR